MMLYEIKAHELAPLSELENNKKDKMIWRIKKHIRKEKLHRNTSLYFAKYEPYFKNLISIQNKGNILVFILIFVMRWFTLHLVLWIKCYVWKKIIPVHGNWSFFFQEIHHYWNPFKANYFKVKIILLSFRSMWFLIGKWNFFYLCWVFCTQRNWWFWMFSLDLYTWYDYLLCIRVCVTYQDMIIRLT